MVEPSPASAFVMVEPNFLFQILKARSMRQRSLAVSTSSGVLAGSVESQNLAGASSVLGHSTRAVPGAQTTNDPCAPST